MEHFIDSADADGAPYEPKPISKAATLGFAALVAWLAFYGAASIIAEIWVAVRGL
jgi:hypothetical protein